MAINKFGHLKFGARNTDFMVPVLKTENPFCIIVSIAKPTVTVRLLGLNEMLLLSCKVASVVSDSVRPQRWQPTRLFCPWDSPGKNTRVGCCFLLQCMRVKSESEVAQSCPTLCDPMDYSPPGSSVHGIFQARTLESRGSFQSWDQRSVSCVSCIVGGFFTTVPSGKALSPTSPMKEL